MDQCERIVAPVDGAGRGGKMSGAAAWDGAAARADEPSRPHRDPGDEPGDGKKRGPSRGVVITIIGALVTAGIATAAVFPGLIGGKPSGPTGDAEPMLAALAPTDIAIALPTLDPVTSKAAVEDAKSCKAPRMGDFGETARLARWYGPHQLGSLSVASISANRRAPAHRHSLPGALPHRPGSTF